MVHFLPPESFQIYLCHMSHPPEFFRKKYADYDSLIHTMKPWPSWPRPGKACQVIHLWIAPGSLKMERSRVTYMFRWELSNMRSCTMSHMPFASKSYAAMLPRHSSWKKKASFEDICEESGIWCHFWSNWSNIDESFNRSNTELDLESLKRHTSTLGFITCLARQIFDSFHGSSWISEPCFPCFPNRDQPRPVRLCEGLPHLLQHDPHLALLECK